MKIATRIKRYDNGTGDAWVYKLSEPHEGYGEGASDHVVVSAVHVMGQPETYIFPCDADGKVTSWGEMPGSQKGTLEHVEALRDAGYEIAETHSGCAGPK